MPDGHIDDPDVDYGAIATAQSPVSVHIGKQAATVVNMAAYRRLSDEGKKQFDAAFEAAVQKRPKNEQAETRAYFEKYKKEQTFGYTLLGKTPFIFVDTDANLRGFTEFESLLPPNIFKAAPYDPRIYNEYFYYHECAHVMGYAEAAADSYAASKICARYGDDGLPILQAIAYGRIASNFLYSDSRKFLSDSFNREKGKFEGKPYIFTDFDIKEYGSDCYDAIQRVITNYTMIKSENPDKRVIAQRLADEEKETMRFFEEDYKRDLQNPRRERAIRRVRDEFGNAWIKENVTREDAVKILDIAKSLQTVRQVVPQALNWGPEEDRILKAMIESFEFFLKPPAPPSAAVQPSSSPVARQQAFNMSP